MDIFRPTTAILGRKVSAMYFPTPAHFGDDYLGDGTIENPMKTLEGAQSACIDLDSKRPLLRENQRDYLVIHYQNTGFIYIDIPGLYMYSFFTGLGNDNPLYVFFRKSNIELFHGMEFQWAATAVIEPETPEGSISNLVFSNTAMMGTPIVAAFKNESRFNEIFALPYSEEDNPGVLICYGGYGLNILRNLQIVGRYPGLAVLKDAESLPNIAVNNMTTCETETDKFPSHASAIPVLNATLESMLSAEDKRIAPASVEYLLTALVRNCYIFTHNTDSNGCGIADLGPEPPPIAQPGDGPMYKKDLNPTIQWGAHLCDNLIDVNLLQSEFE